MPYQNWKDVQDIVERLRICKVKDVVDNLQILRDLIVKRHIVKSSVEYIQATVYTCEKQTRLPANEHFICDGDGLWSFYLDKLNISVRTIHHTVSKSNNFDYNTLQKLEEQSLEYIHKILNLLYNLDGVFTQSTFEKKYSLVWADGEGDGDDGEDAGKVKAARKASNKFRKSINKSTNGDVFRKLIQEEINECMQSKDKTNM